MPGQYLEGQVSVDGQAAFLEFLRGAVDKRLGTASATFVADSLALAETTSSWAVPSHTTEPTLWIVMQPEWTGMLHESLDPPGVFAEVGCAFEVALTSAQPGAAPSFRRLVVPGLPRDTVGAARGVGVGPARNAARIEAKVYAAVLRDAYERLARLVADSLIGGALGGP